MNNLATHEKDGYSVHVWDNEKRERIAILETEFDDVDISPSSCWCTGCQPHRKDLVKKLPSEDSELEEGEPKEEEEEDEDSSDDLYCPSNAESELSDDLSWDSQDSWEPTNLDEETQPQQLKVLLSNSARR